MSISLAPHTGAPAPGRAPARTAAPRRPAARTTLYSRASAGGAPAPRRPAARTTESVESMSGTRCIMPQRRGNFKVSGSEGQVVRALGGIASATLLSRLLGFVRDMIVARAFGAGLATDAFFVAFRVPNILRRLLAEGALSTAVIPVFTDYLVNRSRPEFIRMLRAVLAMTLLALVGATALGIVTAPWLLRVIAPGFTGVPEQNALAVVLTRVMFPYLVLVGLAALAMGVLNAEGKFFASALGPAVLNVGMIV